MFPISDYQIKHALHLYPIDASYSVKELVISQALLIKALRSFVGSIYSVPLEQYSVWTGTGSQFLNSNLQQLVMWSRLRTQIRQQFLLLHFTAEYFCSKILEWSSGVVME